MRLYDDPVEVRRGETDGPDQFLWRGRLWKVRAVMAHWVETAPWWQSTTVQAVVGTDEQPDLTQEHAPPAGADLLVERELWRVEAGRGMAAVTGSDGEVVHTSGVFDLSFSWSDGRWQLVGCAD
ncbi:MAG: hypothetical protein JWN68_1041 [Nocardioides sp.]|jgi:hypothetical protein|uniref:DUF6504 family protein n=1 Tax=Nocardioides sp. TaxID=35761 RepID=UPI00262035F6|nr:DUF6504 family protein [Nocardioides sp.]MCW2833088.1 hypothetical protein [Nocardioides sp.]